MNRKMSKVKALIIGFVLTKMVVAVVYFAGTLPVSAFLSSPATTAEAQQVNVAEEMPAAAPDVKAPEADREKQFAEVMALMKQLEVKRMNLKTEEERIEQERSQLEALKLDIDQKLDELAIAQTTIDAALAQQAQQATQEQQAQAAAEAAKIKQLVKVYTSMSPKKAAEIIDRLDMEVVYEVFSNMKGEQVGQILTYVSGDRAAEITERLAPGGIGQ